MDIIDEFKKCLSTMSHSRAGWDYYDMPPDRCDAEDRRERSALARACAIWAEHPDRHDDLRAAFAAESPLVTMDEIDRGVSSHG